MFIPGSLENGLPPSRCLQTGGCQISFIFPGASVWPMPPAATPLLRFLFLIPRLAASTTLSVIDARQLELRASLTVTFFGIRRERSRSNYLQAELIFALKFLINA